MADSCWLHNPQPGEVWEHRDGGSVYVLAIGVAQVRVQRRPFGDSQAQPWWQRLDMFHASTTGRLSQQMILVPDEAGNG